jgi:hypothetical protein
VEVENLTLFEGNRVEHRSKWEGAGFYIFTPFFKKVIGKVTLSFTPYPLFQLVSAK